MATEARKQAPAQERLLIWGLLVAAAGIAGALALDQAEAPGGLVIVVAAVAGLVAQVLIGIAVVAYGVRIGLRGADDARPDA